MQRVKLFLIALSAVATILSGILAYGYLAYSDNIAATIHGSVTIVSGYGSPWALQFYSTSSPSVVSNVLVDPNFAVQNSTAHYTAILNSGHQYNVLVFVNAPGKGLTGDCGKSPLPDCLLCEAPNLNIPRATTDISYNITVSVCPPPGNQ